MRAILTPKRAAYLALALILTYLLLSYVYGVFLEMTTYHSDLSLLVNRNLLAPWQPGKEEFLITSPSRCPTASEQDWPKTRRQCFLVGNWVLEPCSPLTYGRSCATISVSNVYFNDEAFRSALRSALKDLCAVFKTPAVAEYLASGGKLPSVAQLFGCSETRRVSLSVYIVVLENVGDPPIGWREGITKVVDMLYFSASTGEIKRVQ